MANPQKENGYTPIANEIMEAVARLQINATQFRILMVVWRYTYGFNRKDHKLSETFISDATEIHKKQIQRELTSLIERNILVVIEAPTFKSPRVLGFNKNYNSWEVTKTLPGSKNDTHTGSGLAASPGSGLAPQERKNLKKNIKKVYSDDFETFWSEYPRKKEKKKAFKAWSARVKSEHKPESMITGAKNYAHECVIEKKEEQFIKLPATFIGPNEHFLEYQKPRAPNNEPRGQLKPPELTPEEKERLRQQSKEFQKLTQKLAEEVSMPDGY